MILDELLGPVVHHELVGRIIKRLTLGGQLTSRQSWILFKKFLRSGLVIRCNAICPFIEIVWLVAIDQTNILLHRNLD